VTGFDDDVRTNVQ